MGSGSLSSPPSIYTHGSPKRKSPPRKALGTWARRIRARRSSTGSGRASDGGAAGALGIRPGIDAPADTGPVEVGLGDELGVVGGVVVAFAQPVAVRVGDVPSNTLDVVDHDVVTAVIEHILEFVGRLVELDHVGAVERQVPADLADLFPVFKEFDGERGALVAILRNEQDPLVVGLAVLAVIVVVHEDGSFATSGEGEGSEKPDDQQIPHGVCLLGCGLAERMKILEKKWFVNPASPAPDIEEPRPCARGEFRLSLRDQQSCGQLFGHA